MTSRVDPRSLGLMVFFPAADDIPEEDRLRLARVMVQAILGEYVGALSLDHLEVADANDVDLEKYIQLSDLAAYVSWHEKRHGRKYQ